MIVHHLRVKLYGKSITIVYLDPKTSPSPVWPSPSWAFMGNAKFPQESYTGMIMVHFSKLKLYGKSIEMVYFD